MAGLSALEFEPASNPKPTASLILLLLLGACQPQTHDGVLEDYLGRIARVTGAGDDVPAAEPLAPYPPRRALSLEIPRRTIDVAEFFELHGCDMGALVGFRNSPLGRLQSASQRLGYETAWLEAAEACGADAADWLDELGADKRDKLPALFWNATFAADEMRTALGASADPPGDNLADILRALNDSLGRVRAGGFDVGRLEVLLGRLRQGSWVGPARRDWQAWRRHLGAASTWLEQSLPGLCVNRQPTPAARRLENVFMKFYVQQVQPVLARRMSRHRAWVEALERLSGNLAAVQPPAYRSWFRATLATDDPESEWQRTRAAVVAHVEAWQAVFSHCNLEPVPGLGQD